MKPFLKWPGGKQWFTNHLLKIAPKDYNVYYEPFLGGGAAFFALSPSTGFLSDINSDLINSYVVMRDHPVELKTVMIQHNQNHSKDYYYRVRSHEYNDPIEKAGQFIYLNRTCYNGMYRVNKNGQFNVPIGTKTDCIYDIEQFDEYSRALKKCRIVNSDFVSILNNANNKDLVFADPPYVTKQNSDTFLKYSSSVFSWNDQLRLHNTLVEIRDRGAYIILTNTNDKSIRTLYTDSGFYISSLQRKSTISGSISGRGNVFELLITSFPV